MKRYLERFSVAIMLLASMALTLGAGVRWNWRWRPSSRTTQSGRWSPSWRWRAQRSSWRPASAGA